MKNNKLNKIILLTVILSFIFTMAADAVVFTDISSHWAKSYIERVAENELVSGYENKTFKPDNNVTVLEALVMLSRLYEIDDDLKDEIIEKYEPVLETMSNTKGYEWSFDYLSLIIEMGVVSESGIKDMFSKKTVFNDATREEIAVLLTKAMMLGDQLKKAFVLPFNDQEKISEVAKPYVYTMYDKEIMQGDNKKNFNPTNKITRAEIATVLDKAYDYIGENEIYPDFEDYVPTTVEEGIITKLSEEKTGSYIYIKNNKDVESVVKINDETKIYINERTRKFSDLKEDMLVTCKVDENRLAVKIEADNTKKVARGIIYYVAYSAPAAITINDGNDDRVKYDVSTDADVYLDGKDIALKDLKKNDVVTLLLDNNKVYQINSVSRIKEFEGTITSIDYTSYPIKLSIKTKESVIKTFEFNSDVEVTRNDKEASFDRVRVGDDVTITTEYDEMIKINTVAKEAEMSGTIKEIIIGPVNKIKIADKNGDVEQYSVSSNVVVTIGNKNASINDLRVGYNVEVNTSGDEIVTIEASELQTAMNFAGKIIFINKDDKLIMMQNVNSSGQTELVYLRITNSTKIFNISGETKYLKDMAEGQSILSTAISQGGEYVAVSIMIQ
jgi:predicted RNA-binding protein